MRPGPIVDETGRVLARHDGVHRFTVGQRKGLGIATGRPTFVERIDGATGTVHVASGERLLGHEALVTDVCLGERVTLPLEDVSVRVRYRHEGAAARVEAHRDGARVVFAEPTRALTPGQVAVFYEGACVVGGGRITAGEAPEARAS